LKSVRAKQVLMKVAHFEKPHLMKICSMVFLCTALSWEADAKGNWQENCLQTAFYLGQSRISESIGLILKMQLPYQFQLLRLLPDWASRTGGM
jgi:hypothetical protein